MREKSALTVSQEECVDVFLFYFSHLSPRFLPVFLNLQTLQETSHHVAMHNLF